jgi:Ca2+-binding RTX toxin-like protein
VAGNYAVQGGGGISEQTLSNGAYGLLPDLDNTIVADNDVLVGSDSDLSGSFTVARSLVEDPGTAGLTGPDTILGLDPQLQALAANGGPTQTQAPLLSSPVVDAGGSTSLSDQRFLDRPIDIGSVANTNGSTDGTDIGAVELQSTTDSQPAQAGGGGGGGAADSIPLCKGKTATVFPRPGLARSFNGTNKKDVIVGTNKKDTIRAKGGNDIVCAKGGKDTVKGGGGKDKLYGQGGKDKLFGQGGKDLLSGGGKNDTCVGGAGTDTEKSC